MNFDELKTIAKKCKKYTIIESVSIIALTVIGLIAICSIGAITENKVVFSIGAVIVIVLMTVYMISANLYRREREKGGSFVIKIIKTIIEDYGISPENYVLTTTSENSYIVGFHNQNVDYDVLNEKISEALSSLNAILKSGIRIKLI